MTAENAANDLGITTLAVRRLAARGVLKAAYVAGDSIRILPADLAEYAAAGCPDARRPPLDPTGGFRSEGAYVDAYRLGHDIQEALSKIASETAEAPSTPEVIVPIVGELAKIVTGEPYRPLARLSGVDYTPPFATRAEGFAVVYLRERVVGSLMRSRTSGPIEALYRTQTSYRDAVNAAWNAWAADSFSVYRTFPAARNEFSEPKTVTFRVPYSALAVDQQRVTQLAF